MKLISKGNGKWQPWWIGNQMKCSECGQVVKLEAGDEDRADWIPVFNKYSVSIRCECCGNIATLKS